MPEPLLLAVALVVAGAVVLLPLRRAGPALADDGRDAAAVRHRVALEALLDVEADRRAGSLDDASYAEQRAEVEARAAATASALDRLPVPSLSAEASADGPWKKSSASPAPTSPRGSPVKAPASTPSLTGDRPLRSSDTPLSRGRTSLPTMPARTAPLS